MLFLQKNFSLFGIAMSYRFFQILSNYIKAKPTSYASVISQDLRNWATFVYPIPETKIVVNSQGRRTTPIELFSSSTKSMASVYYLFDSLQFRRLMQEQRTSRVKDTNVAASLSEKTPEATGNGPKKRKIDFKDERESDDDLWRVLTQKTLPSMVTLPSLVRRRAVRLAEFIKRQRFTSLDPDNNSLLFPDVETEATSPEIIRGTDIVEILVFFTSADDNVPRPLELYSLLKFLIAKKADDELFSERKLPRKLLKAMKTV